MNLCSCNGEVGYSDSLFCLVVDSDGKLINKFIAELIPFHLEAFHIVFLPLPISIFTLATRRILCFETLLRHKDLAMTFERT